MDERAGYASSPSRLSRGGASPLGSQGELREHPELLKGWSGPGDLKAEDALFGKTLTASDFIAADPSLAMRFDAYGIPRDAIVEMEPGLLFIFDPGGFRDVMPPQTTPDGKSYPRTMSNRLKFVVVGS